MPPVFQGFTDRVLSRPVIPRRDKRALNWQLASAAFFTSLYRSVAWIESSRTSSTTRATASSAPRPGTLSSPLRISHAGHAPMGCRPRSTSRRSHGAGVFAPGRWTTAPARRAVQAGMGWRSIGRSPTAISLKNNGGGHRRGRPCLVGRAMAVTDHAAALFFRAVDRDRHPTPACTASRRRRGNEKRSTAIRSCPENGRADVYQERSCARSTSARWDRARGTTSSRARR